jgi:hypothetical protein
LLKQTSNGFTSIQTNQQDWARDEDKLIQVNEVHCIGDYLIKSKEKYKQLINQTSAKRKRSHRFTELNPLISGFFLKLLQFPFLILGIPG